MILLTTIVRGRLLSPMINFLKFVSLSKVLFFLLLVRDGFPQNHRFAANLNVPMRYKDHLSSIKGQKHHIVGLLDAANPPVLSLKDLSSIKVLMDQQRFSLLCGRSLAEFQ